MALARAAATAGTAGTAAPLPCRAGASTQTPCRISSRVPTSTIVGLWHKHPLIPSCRPKPGHCCPLSVRAQGHCHMHSTQTRPPCSPLAYRDSTRQHADPKAHPQPAPILCPTALGPPDQAQSCTQKTAPQPQTLRPSSPQRRTGTHRVEVPRCRWLRGGSRAGESAQAGLPEPCVCLWPSSCTYVRSPRGSLVQTRAELLPPHPEPTDPGPHCPPSTSARTCPRGAGREQDGGPGHRWDTGQEEGQGPGSGRPRHLFRLAPAAPCPARCRPAPPARAPPEERPSPVRRGETRQILPPSVTAPGGQRGPAEHGPGLPCGSCPGIRGARRQPGGHRRRQSAAGDSGQRVRPGAGVGHRGLGAPGSAGDAGFGAAGGPGAGDPHTHRALLPARRRLRSPRTSLPTPATNESRSPAGAERS